MYAESGRPSIPPERLQLIPAGHEHILEKEDGKQRWVQVVRDLSQADWVGSLP